MAMNFNENDGFCNSISALNEDILAENLLLSHEPDGRWLDSEMLLHEVEHIMNIIFENQVSCPSSETWSCINNIEIIDSTETLSYAISRISVQILSPCTGEKDVQTRTMVLFDLLQSYRWDAKVVIILGALAVVYGGIWLPKQLSSSDPMAASVAALDQMLFSRRKLCPWIKSMILLVKAMVDVTKCIIEFTRLPIQHVKIDNNGVGETMSRIYLAAYWVVRSAIACLQKGSDSRVAKRELSSLGYRLWNIQIHLTKRVEELRQQIDEEIYLRLHDVFVETREDNQEALRLLFALQDDFPLQAFSRQIAITELKNKVIVLLLSKPELLPLEPLLFLLQQTYDHPSDADKDIIHDTIWIPIPSSPRWTEEEKGMFESFSNSLPWCSVRRPWLMSSTVVKFIREKWKYSDHEVMMVVLDSNGRTVNMNAIDMVFIWGARAYPFSVYKEDKLWEEAGWSMELLLHTIHPAFEKLVEERRDVCIYGSDDSNWIDELKSQARKLQNLGFQFELIYLGKRDRDELTKTISSATTGGSIVSCSTMQQFFWLRLKSIRRSKLRRAKSPEPDRVFEEVSKLLDFDYDEHKGWAIVGKASAEDIVQLTGGEVTECLPRIQRWGENATELGFTGAVKIAVEAEKKPCDQTHELVVPFEGERRRAVTCDKCKRPMLKSVVYQ